ncbi:MAG: insulinase family protein [Bacteroidales bacterium]|nr:insulinase family protein [Bacteroidales bacterium]
MKLRRFWLFTLMLLVASTTFAQFGGAQKAEKKTTDLSAKVPVDKKVRIGKLENGMTYYIRANKKPENRAQFRLAVNAGSILEDADQLGLAHFCEHMAFNGTKHYKGNEMISELQKKGIEFGRGINAWTSFDETVYYVDLPTDSPEMIEMGFKILDGWADGLLFEGEEIEKERGVILEEWRGGLGAGERMRKATWPTMLKGSLYAERLPIGEEEIIRTFKHETIKRFYNDWYRTDLQAIIIVGDIDVDATEAKIKEYFGKYTKHPNPRERKEFGVPGNVEPLVAIATDKEATSTTINMFWKHKKAPQGTVGDYRQSLVRSLVNNMLSARFGELSQKASAPFVYADAGYGGFLGRSTDAFTAAAMPKENQIDATVEMLLTELKRADQHGFVQTELDRAKEDMLSSYQKYAKEENKTQSVSFANEYTNHFLEGEVIPGIRQEYRYVKEFMPTITLEEVNALIAGWITDENFVFYLTAPEKEGYKVPTKDEVLAIVAKMKNVQTEPYVDNYKDEPLFAKELNNVNAKISKKNDKLGYTEYTLPNGVRFVVKQTNFKEDEILVRAFSFGGSSLYEDKEYLTASWASSIVDGSGIADFDNSQLGKKLQGMNISISPFISSMEEGFSGNCSPKDFETLLQLTYLYFDAPRKDKESFDRFLSQMKNQYKFIGENPQYVFIDKFQKVAYPNDKRNVLIPTEEQMNAVDYERAFNIYKERFADASDFTFFFVGNVSDEMISTISKYLGNLPSINRKETWKDRSTDFAKGIQKETVKKGMDNQGMLIMMGVTEGFEATTKNKMAVNMLSDAIGITAIEVIREKMGGTYSPSAGINYEILPKPEVSWQFFINCDPSKAGEIEKAAMDIMEQYIKKGPDDATLAKVKEQMIRARETNLKENSFWASILYGSYYYGLDRTDEVLLDDYKKLVDSITAEDIKAIAKKYINLKNYIVVTLEPEQVKE